MTYKVIEKVTVSEGFPTRACAKEWASQNLTENEDRTWEIRKE